MSKGNPISILRHVGLPLLPVYYILVACIVVMVIMITGSRGQVAAEVQSERGCSGLLFVQ